MKILHVVYNLIRGGTEGQCARLIFELHRRGVEQCVAVTHREGFFLDAVERAVGPAFELGITRTYAPSTWLKVRQFSRWMKAEGVTLVHAWDADAAVFGSMAARWAGLPLMTSRRDLGEIYAPRKAQRMMKADQQAVAVVANAQRIRDRFVQAGVQESKIHVIPNIVDVEEFDRLSAVEIPSDAKLPKGPLIGMVTRLDPEKDAPLFVEAALRVLQAMPDAGFVIAGDGPDRKQLEERVRASGAGDRFAFLGDITWVPPLLAKLAVGVLAPKANEGLSNTILEYMAARLPVVATDCGGNNELARDGETGFVIPVGDAQALADRLIQLLRSPEQRSEMGATGRAVVETRHRPAIIGDEFLKLYRQIANCA